MKPIIFLILLLCCSSLFGQVARPNHGGTGQSTYVKGDLLCASAATALQRLAAGADGLFLVTDSTQSCGIKWSSSSSTIASGTAVMGTSAIASGACAAAVTVAATGVVSTDVITAGFNGDPTAITGYIPLTTGVLTIYSYPTAGNVSFKVCNMTSASVTPGALTLNWRVAR